MKPGKLISILMMALGLTVASASEPGESVLSLKPEETEEIKLRLAQTLRGQQNYDAAAKLLVNILEGTTNDVQRPALLELATVFEQQRQWARAQQVFAQYLQRYPEDSNVAAVLLRQGVLYRQMGAPTMALAKFYAVLTTVLNLKLDGSGHFQRLVLQAQTEIADTYYQEDKFAEATEYYERLLKLDSPDLDKAQIRLKIVRCLAKRRHYPAVVAQAGELVKEDLAPVAQVEARFHLAAALRQLNRKSEAFAQALAIAETPNDACDEWKQRVANEVANALYLEGDYANALALYLALLKADPTPAWQLPVLYQVGLTYERLHDPKKASEYYARLAAHVSPAGAPRDPALETMLDLARWRKGYLSWQPQPNP